jgi:hypothetical protein
VEVKGSSILRPLLKQQVMRSVIQKEGRLWDETEEEEELQEGRNT